MTPSVEITSSLTYWKNCQKIFENYERKTKFYGKNVLNLPFILTDLGNGDFISPSYKKEQVKNIEDFAKINNVKNISKIEF